MNTETLQHTTLPSARIPGTWLRRIHHLFTGYAPQPAGRPGPAHPGNSLANLPIEEKLRLGLYRYMD